MSSKKAIEFDNVDELLCDYGCGIIAKFKFSNGKVCCSESENSCIRISKRKHDVLEIENEEGLLCEYGCGQEAKYKLYSGKLCCSKHANGCPVLKKKRNPIVEEIITDRLCDLGCGQIAKFRYGNGKFYCSSNSVKCPTSRLKLSISRQIYVGENHPRYGKHCTDETKSKISMSNIEWNKNNTPIWLGRHHKEESKKLIGLRPFKRVQSIESRQRKREKMLNGHSDYMNSISRNPEKIKRFKERQRKWMLENGRYVKSFISNPSRDEIKLRDMVKEHFPDCEFQYPVLNYDLDVAIPEYKIAIEFDGYYHFDTEEHKEYYKMRQKRIEDEGWVFYRVTMFDKFPTSEEAKLKIESLIEEIGNKNEPTNER